MLFGSNDPRYAANSVRELSVHEDVADTVTQVSAPVPFVKVLATNGTCGPDDPGKVFADTQLEAMPFSVSEPFCMAIEVLVSPQNGPTGICCACKAVALRRTTAATVSGRRAPPLRSASLDVSLRKEFGRFAADDRCGKTCIGDPPLG
jgi:hypothetical protein